MTDERPGHDRPGDQRAGRAADERPDEVWARATAAFTRWLAGDPVALDDLVAEMTPVLWHVVRAYRLDEEAAQDVVQTTWLTFVRRSSSILDPVAVGAWLTTTARREAWRVAGSGTRVVPVDDDDLGARLPSTPSPEATVVAEDRSERIWRAVDGLPERCRRLLRVVAFEHRPDYSVLAGQLDMPVGSIGPTRGRCLAKLRVALMQVGEIG